MTINVNNQEQNIEFSSSLEYLLKSLNITSKGIAIALNNKVISKNDWKNTLLKEQDHVTIIQATQGG